MRRAALAALLFCALVALPAAAAPSVMALVHADRWAEAEAKAAALPDPVAAKLVTFYRMLAPGAATVDEIDAFRAANPTWPLQAALLHRREAALAATPDDAAVRAACARETPSGATALARCAQAARTGDAAAAATYARAAWIAAGTDAAWNAAFLRQWSADIDPATHWARFASLAWSDTAAAGLEVPLLEPADQQRAEARLAVRRDDPQAAALLAALPPGQRDQPVMVLERARWLRRTGHADAALALWLRHGADAEQSARAAQRPAFWTERSILARQLLQRGEAAHAYALAAGTAQTAPEQQADAAFLAGWIALRRLSDPAEAARRFAVVARVSRAAISQARAHYWLARAAAAAGDTAGAARDYAAAAAYPSTYYGQLATLAETGDPARLAARIVAARGPAWTRDQAIAFASGELARGASWLVAWGEPGRAAPFLLRLGQLATSARDRALAAHLATGFDMPQTAVALARLAGREGDVLLDTGWPVAAAVPRGGAVDPALVLGIIRQESSFDPAVVSPAGARGLMQLMPATAALEARGLGADASPAALLAEPALNIRLGTSYLQGLLARFGKVTALAVAAYNAGPLRVASWVEANGDPRLPSGAAGRTDIQDWIELIPFGETRNYVQRVLENTAVYQAKLGEAAPYPVPWRASPA